MPTIFQDRCGVSLYDAQYTTGEKVPISDDVIREVLAALLRFKIYVRVLVYPKTRSALLQLKPQEQPSIVQNSCTQLSKRQDGMS